MAKFLFFPGILFIVCSLRIWAQPPVKDLDTLRRTAEQWVAIILEFNGHWHGEKTATVEEIREFKEGECLVGYLCSIKPSGFILLSPYEELVPVKAYSCDAHFCPSTRTGMVAFLQAEMRQAVDGLLKSAAAADRLRTSVHANSLSRNVEWNNLVKGVWGRGAPDPAGQAACSQPGEVLLRTAWDQSFPYNDKCPVFSKGGSNQHAYAGCAAIAAAQIMRYWCWPPYRNDVDLKFQPYDWPNMVDWCKYSVNLKQWQDEKGQLLTQKKITAMARLCYETGAAAGTRYGCDKSSAWIADQPGRDMLDGLRTEFFYDSNMAFKCHNVMEPIDWFALIKKEINENRPVLYAVQNAATGGHCLVIDGWQEIGETPIRMYHVNVGQGPYDVNVWCTIDSVPYSRYYDSETMVIGIKPICSLGATLAGQYTAGSFPFFYVDQNASGENADFAAGLTVQFLAGTKVVCLGNADARITWSSSDHAKTVLYSKGNIRQGIKLAGGKIVLRHKGGIRFPR